jgi:succinate-semialdehyde dehydrogenase / glutarate-semialdehyde dehydrogenase
MILTSKVRDSSLIKNRYFCDGQWQSAASEATFPVVDPSTNAVIAVVPNADADDALRAIEAASLALPKWRALTGKARAVVLRRWFDLLCENANDLAALISAEEGKPLAEAKGEVEYGASFVEWFAEEAKRVNGDVLQTPQAGKRLLTLKQAIGVCTSITPWNFPMAMITRKVAPALAAGCTIIVKPAEQTPLTALAIAELAMRAGVPAGVLNILTADAANSVKIGKVLTTDPRIAHLSFTGSTEVGRILMKQCSSTIKKVALELGGHAPFVVFDDADLDAAINGALAAKYRNAGQACISPNRFYVQAGIYQAFVAGIAARTADLRVGNAFEPEVGVGPLIDQAAVAKVQQHVEDAKRLGAEVVTGGTVTEGNFFAPTVMTGVTPEMLMSREETFGPVIGIARFETEDEVIALANHKEYGLAAYLYTRDISRAWRVAEALEFGMIGINTGSISNEVAPFGGVKQSGLGREGSKYGIDEYLEMKYLCVGLQ